MAAPLHFYFDFISPYGWLASLEVDALAGRHGRTVEWHSMLLGVSVLKVMGLKPLLDTPLKGDYARRDLARALRKRGLQPRRGFDQPVMDPLPAARAFYWVKHHHPGQEAAFAAAVYDACWMQGLDLSSAQAVAAIRLPAGIDAQALRAGIESDEARGWLREAVAASLQAGVFGSPTIVVDGEPFWGQDRLPEVEEWLVRGGW
ncbi:2-hydroxychromene-2-carboxylate isomerase [Caenimonas sedimenti]|uniref:2-hydroxychromene-2-carboxylate isomerase n=1 Tax=Caenimonas sedimenti TaxID=2596921 RepID=A0A562ZVS1_9BURK|nr:2-hydroxychromene-2-carboxylate isomerase [Caenimonas sedimenti]TWO72563.1 2-hydroxychromene-2-carboxylate isomerase [Caenimonas sedimenti]